MSTDDLKQMLKRKVIDEHPVESVPHENGNGNGNSVRRQRVLDAPEAAELINKGSCEFVGNLPSGKVVVADLQPA
jgi:hypothetical protein